jgi:hypothetical protein
MTTSQSVMTSNTQFLQQDQTNAEGKYWLKSQLSLAIEFLIVVLEQGLRHSWLRRESA